MENSFRSICNVLNDIHMREAANISNQLIMYLDFELKYVRLSANIDVTGLENLDRHVMHRSLCFLQDCVFLFSNHSLSRAVHN